MRQSEQMNYQLCSYAHRTAVGVCERGSLGGNGTRELAVQWALAERKAIEKGAA